MKTFLRLLLLHLLVLTPVILLPGAEPLADGFAQPPESTKPWCYWYWTSDNISSNGITHDLEAMVRVGIGDVAAVTAAIDAGSKAVGQLGKLVAAHVIARPHDELVALLPK